MLSVWIASSRNHGPRLACSMRAGMFIATARMVSVISPALSAASRSDRSESVRVTGGSPSCDPGKEHAEDHAGDPPKWWTLYTDLHHVTVRQPNVVADELSFVEHPGN